jgi:hypothetical protein
MSDARMVKVAELWQRKSAKGTVYFSGFMGDAQLLLFKDGARPHPTKPDETVVVWKLFVQERDPSKRPAARRQAPMLEARVINAREPAAAREPCQGPPDERFYDDSAEAIADLTGARGR